MQDCTLVEIQAGPQFLFLALVGFSTVSSPRENELLKAAGMVHFDREITQELCLAYTYSFCPCRHGISTERTASG